MIRAGMIAFVSATLVLVTPARAEPTIEDLKQQLAVEKAENAHLRRRVEDLENAAVEAAQPTLLANFIAAPESGPAEAEDNDGDRALERALVVKGRSVLPAFALELSPSLAWDHSGSNLNQNTSEAYAGAVTLAMGLPWDTQITVGAPYFFHAQNSGGQNQGLGDASVALSKQLVAQAGGWPSVVATIAWSAPTGQDSFESSVPLGSGFHALKGTLGVVKSIDPIAYYGDVSYRAPQTWDGADMGIEPGPSVAVRAGGALAVTPDITFGAGVSFAFVDEYEQNGVAIAGSARTIGAAELNTGIALGSTFLYISGQFGITDDAPDAGVNLTMPVRF